ncbi:MAG: efflux RND transporter permease subunit [Planctomycetes bacterium]|nr:efflux RND transporter permease subunit [Planctomycetota bacterium]
MFLSDLSIKNPVFAWMLMLSLLLFGGIGFARLGVSQMPDVDFPVVTVAVTLEGAAPEIMETDVVDLIEDAVMTVDGVREVSSSSKNGAATITIEFNLGRNIDQALQEVQTKIAQAQRRLPRDLDPPVVTKTNPEDQPIMWVALAGARPPQDLADYVRFTLKEKLQTVPGVAEIMLGGYLDRNVRVWLDLDGLETYRLTVEDVVAALAREHVEVPAGRIETSVREVNVRVEGEAFSLEGLRSIVVAERGGRPVLLRDVALVQDGFEDVRRIARSMGLPAQGMGIKKQRGANAVAVGQAVKARVAELRKQLPKDLELSVVFDATAFVEEAIHEIEFTLVLSILLTAFVCWLFLGSLTSTLNILLAIPTSIIGAFAAMYFLGFTLNTFSLLALSLSVGIVVDDAIMVMENIVRHAQSGKDRVRASSEGTGQIAFAAIAATAAILAIFLPVAFMKGIIGVFFFQFGVTLSVAVALSLLEALTLTPSRCAQFLDVGARTTRIGALADHAFGALARFYGGVLRWCLRWRLATLLLATALFVSSCVAVLFLPREFVPSQDQSRFLARIQTPVGTSIEATDELVRRCEAYAMAQPELDRYFSSVGGFGGGDVNTAILFATFKPKRGRQATMQDLMARFRTQLNRMPGVRVGIQDLSQTGFSAQRGYPVEFSIRGADWDKLAEVSREVMDRMKETGLCVDVDTDYLVGQPEAKVLPDRKRAADLGVSMASIGTTVNALVGGVRAGRFKSRGRRYDVRVRLLRAQRFRPEDLRRLAVRNREGALIRLSDVVTVKEEPTLQVIQRRGRERAIGVFGNVAPGKSQADALAAVERIGREVVPEGYRLVVSGSAQTFRESFESLLFALGLGILVAYMILASQFNSFAHPLTILLALPFSVTGALVALWLAGASLNIYSMIGILLLMGIAKKNSILLVDYTNQLREAGKGRDEALLEACPVRLRPILMTSLSTVAGAVPGALALGPGGEIRVPMCMAVIGGMVVSTLLTLVVVPAFYSLLDAAKEWLGGVVSRTPEMTLREPVDTGSAIR